MGKVKASVVYLSKEKQKTGISVSLPDDMNVGEILDNLCKKLDLLQDEEYDIDDFALYSRENKKTLSKRKDLLSQGVKDGATLIIKTKKPSAVVKEETIEEESREEPETPEQTEPETQAQAETEASDEEVFEEAEQETYYEPVEEEFERKPIMLCHVCKNELSWDDAFCRKCGQKVSAVEEAEEEQVLLCPVCKNEISKDDVFCRKCGLWIEEFMREEKKKKKGGAMRSALILLFIISLTFVSGVVLERKGIIKVPYALIKDETEVTQVDTYVDADADASEVTTEANEDRMTVEVTIQSDFLREDNMPQETLSQEQLDRGFTAVKINEDDSVTYTIIKSEWRKLLNEFKQDVIKSIAETTKEYNAIDRIIYNEDFSEFTIAVNKELYEYDFDRTVCLSLYLSAGYYQMFNLDEPGCTFKLVDAQTKKVIDKIDYPLERK